MRKKTTFFDISLNIFFVILCACFIIPLMLIVSASVTSERMLIHEGFSILPREFTWEAYQTSFGSEAGMLRAYGVTAFQAIVGSMTSNLVAGMIAYPLARSNFRFKKIITIYVFFTMLFGATMIPQYIIYSKVYHISNTIWIYLLPGLHGGAWTTLIYRTFFKSLPESLFESAKIDGAKDLLIYFRIVIPLSTPVYATNVFRSLVGKWNDYSTSMIYIRDEKLYTLQYLLQRIMFEAQWLKQLANNSSKMGNVVLDVSELMPTENLKYAMCVIAAGPMLVAFPFFQKYFSKGLMIGSIKG